MTKTEAELRAEIEYLDACLLDIDTKAEGRSLDAETQTQFDEGLALRNKLHAELTKVTERKEALRTLASLPSHVETSDPDPLGEPRSVRQDRKVWDLDATARALHQETPERGGSELRSRALDAIEKASGVNERSKQHITKLLEAFDMEDDEDEGRGARKLAAHVITTSSPEYMRAWTKAYKTGMRNGHPDVGALSVLQRAMSLTDSAGGYAVPLPVDPTLILDDNGTVCPIRNIATVRTIVTDQLRSVSSGAVSASYDAEAAEVSDDATTFANIDITMRMARAFIPHSIEIGMDYPGFTQDVAFLLADAKMNLENTVFISGAAGSNQPIGIETALTGTAYELASNTVEVFALSDVYDLDEELPARFSDNAVWLAHKSTYQAIREAGGANLDDYWVNLRDGRPPTLIGHPALEASAMDPASGIDATATAEHKVLILGDFRFYWIVDRVGFSLELIPHLFHTSNNRPSGQRGIFAYWRNGADSVLDRAFRMLEVTTTA